MTPTQQIIPGPRLPEGRNSGRGSAIELSHPIASRPRPEASVNYSALLRRHRNAVALLWAVRCCSACCTPWLRPRSTSRKSFWK